MRKLLFAAALMIAVAVTGVAQAQDANDPITVKSSALTGGAAKKPKPVAPSYTIDLAGAIPGQRAATPSEHLFSWTGVTENGKYFKTCTADQIDMAQSDSVCNPKSMVGKGSLTALIGPEGVRAANTQCAKDFTIYNSGAGKMTLFPHGDPAKCAGIDYLPPVKITWSKKGNTSTQRLVFPENIVHPLPGLEGAFTHINYQFVKRTTTIGTGKAKRTVGYLMSTGCGSSKDRTFTFTAKTNAQPAGTTSQVPAGSC